MPSLCVLGLGYIGLPTASIFATKGRRVLGVDVSASVVDTINRITAAAGNVGAATAVVRLGSGRPR